MTGLFTRKRPPLRRVLLIESSKRQVSNQLLEHLYRLDEIVQVDVLTCYSNPLPAFQDHRGQIFLVADPAIARNRRQFVYNLATTPYDAVAIHRSSDHVLRKWRWMLAILTQAKLLIVKKDTTFLFLDYGYLHDLQVQVPRLRREHLVRFRLTGQVLIMPFMVFYLLLYAGYAHMRRLLQLSHTSRLENTDVRL